MNQAELIAKLTELRKLDSENEVVEFKEAKNDKNFDDIGKYFSALSNEANLNGVADAWLIFGIRDKDRAIVGTSYRSNSTKLQNLKKEIADHTTGRISFKGIWELNLPEGRVVMFQIPAAPIGIPVAWKGHNWARDHESLCALNPEKYERIRNQVQEDWSKEICPEAAVYDLDPAAIKKARENYKSKFKDKASDVDSWDDITFLNKAKITIGGNITRTAIVLLGKEESEHFVSPSEVKIRWILKDSKGTTIAHQIESCPFILAVDKINDKIRKIKYRYIKSGTLFPEEIDQYDPFSIREALNNCIAHQDYRLRGRINVIEHEDRLTFTNRGHFLPESVEEVIKRNAPEETYRNNFLATAMVNLKMVETAGEGIIKLFDLQKQRRFPLPEYDLSNNRVEVTLIGKILDVGYAQVLARDSDLSLEEIMMLDKVQKKKKLSEPEIRHLKKKKLIEGKKPNYYISLKVAQRTDQKVEYTKTKGLDKQKYFDWIIEFINEHNVANRKQINELLMDHLPARMSNEQKKNKINNLLSELRKTGKIINSGTAGRPRWILVE